ncbi:MAG: hypothetical protein VKJ86_08190 [Synechococcus sp.]|nr:hypothetical protein [Synechococcus sp.]
MNTLKSNQEQGIYRIGEVLEAAGLISEAQLEIALFDQQSYDNLKLGEILALRGWVDQQTADFFARYTKNKLTILRSKRLGDYLREAYLLTPEQLSAVLDEQKMNHMLFGSVAVLKGYINQKTLNFFLRNILNQATADQQFWRTTHRETMAVLGKLTEIARPAPTEIIIADKTAGGEPPEINWIG